MIKIIPPANPDANLKAYGRQYQEFSWENLHQYFSWAETGELNIVHEAIDRRAKDREQRERTALIVEANQSFKEYSYQDLREISSQWANLFMEHDLGLGDRVFIFLHSCPEIYFALLACARQGIIFSILPDSLDYDELAYRISNTLPKAIITNYQLSKRLPEVCTHNLNTVFFTDGPLARVFRSEVLIPKDIEGLPKRNAIKWVAKTTPLFISYVSGCDGPPKGIVHNHIDMLAYFNTSKFVMNLSENDKSWADCGPHSSIGIIYGVIGPWLVGAIPFVQMNKFNASIWYKSLEKHKVKVWYTSPQKLQQLEDLGDDLPRRYRLSDVKHIVVSGDSLKESQFAWAKRTFRASAHECWFMEEAGMICISNFLSESIKLGSMGKAVPGVSPAVFDENGDEVPDYTSGELVFKIGWPAMMSAIWNDSPCYRRYFRQKNWFFTGELVYKDREGYYFFQGRNDDLITFNGNLVGPYEIEKLLSGHPLIDEVAVIAIGSESSSFFKGFIKLKNGAQPNRKLSHQIIKYVNANFDEASPLEKIEYLDEMPKSTSGRILRRALRAMHLGLPIGDETYLQD